MADDTPELKDEHVVPELVFSAIEQAQSNHGIPHQDYAQYHKYCTSKLERLRRLKEVRQHLVQNPKYVDGTGKQKKNAFCKRTLRGDEDKLVTRHENVFWSALFQAERSWAHACELQGSSGHSQVRRKLNKAQQWAQQLVSVANELKCSETTVLETQSYAAWMKGNACLEKKDFLGAFRSYQESRDVLLQLANNEGSKLTLRDLWTTRAESTLRPLIRFCHYEARDKLEATDVLVEANGSSSKAGGDSAKLVVNFRGQDIALDEYKDLTVLYLKLDARLNNPSLDLDEDHYLQLLSDLDDALKAVQHELSHLESLTAGPLVNQKIGEMKTLSAYFHFQKLSLWRHQQEKRLADLSELPDIVHIYDTLLQNANSLADLAQGESDMEEDDLWLETQAHLVRIRAFRCYYLARLYEDSIELDGSAKDVLALARQAHSLGKRAIEELAACDSPDIDRFIEDLQSLQSMVNTLICRAEATMRLESTNEGVASHTNRPLWLRLDELDGGSVLADAPPLAIPIPCKPAFFDIAWQHVAGSFPVGEIESIVAEHDAAKAKSKSFFGRWLG